LIFRCVNKPYMLSDTAVQNTVCGKGYYAGRFSIRFRRGLSANR
jgi:hypothetical protein